MAEKLTAEQIVVVNSLARKSMSEILAIQLLVVIVVLVLLIVGIGVPKEVVMLVALLLTLFLPIILAKTMLFKQLVKKRTQGCLVLVNAEIRRSAYQWRWAGIVLLSQFGLGIGSAAILSALNLEGNSGLGIGVAIGSTYLATYLIISRMLKKGDAVLEINPKE